MVLFTSSLIYDLVAIFVTITALGVAFLKWRFQYWTRVGLKTLHPSIPFGDVSPVIKGQRSFGEQFRHFYDDFKAKGYQHGGVYFGIKPFYVPVDPNIIKNIMQKDFQHFQNRGVFIDEENDPLSGHLVNLEDSKWKTLRSKLTPTFTSGKMKMMFQTMADCSVGLQTIMNEAAVKKEPVDIKDVLGRFTTDIIGSTAFGLDCNSLKDPDTLFRKYGKLVFEDTPYERIKGLMQFMFPRSLLKFLRFKLTKPDVEKFFFKVITDTVNYREKNNVSRKDFMQLLLQLKNHGKVTDEEHSVNGKSAEVGLTMNELAAQAVVFFLAGFETSSTTMTFALFSLATNPEIQEKLRDEITTVLNKHNGQITYDAIMEMTYMDKVLDETLRQYPPVQLLVRRCNKDYKVPNTDIVIEKGVDVGISVDGLHHDPDYYPNPEKFDPERFTEENKCTRPQISWIPFGDGPRICIGLRFGLMQSKVGLTALLNNYRVRLNSKTVTPLTFEKSNIILSAEGGVWLDVEKLK